MTQGNLTERLISDESIKRATKNYALPALVGGASSAGLHYTTEISHPGPWGPKGDFNMYEHLDIGESALIGAAVSFLVFNGIRKLYEWDHNRNR